jgi:carbamoyltransferase
MFILGITNGETAGASLIKNRNIIAAASEERFSRIKLDNSWPENSISYVLKEAKINLSQVDFVAYSWSKEFDANKDILNYFDRIVYEAKNNSGGLKQFRDRIEVELRRDAIKRQEFIKFITKNKIKQKAHFIDHHTAHAFSSLSCSNFKSALVITADGRGDFSSLTVSLFKNKKINTLYRSASNDSLGTFYARISKLLGFIPHRHEGKVTGLAAKGNSYKFLNLMKKMIKYENGKIFGINSEYYKSFHDDHGRYKAWTKKAIKEFGNFKKEDVAAAAQKHLENIIVKLVQYYQKKTNETNICLAGGVFANVLVNQKIRELKSTKNIFIQPHMGDGGLCLGACASLLYDKKKLFLNFKNVYLGPSFKISNDEISKIENKFSVKFIKINNIPELIISNLANNKVVGLFQGRMEFGPRALCNRSILYHCRDKEINVSLNKRLNRDEFMPFAPVTTNNLAPKLFKNWNKNQTSSKYMTMTYDCTNLMKRNSPAVVHIDGTARPQIIFKKDNKLMYKILKLWFKKNSGYSLINTSFNHHEEPIVCSPVDAIKSYLRNNIDTLVINNFIIKKN